MELTAVKVTWANDETAGTVLADPDVSATVTCWRISEEEVAVGTVNTAWLGVLDSLEPMIDQPVAVLTLLPATHVRCSSCPFRVL